MACCSIAAMLEEMSAIRSCVKITHNHISIIVCKYLTDLQKNSSDHRILINFFPLQHGHPPGTFICIMPSLASTYRPFENGSSGMSWKVTRQLFVLLCIV